LSDFTHDEIAQVLKVAELLKQKGCSQKINVQQFCEEAGISRKNAYKHKNNRATAALEKKIERLEQLKLITEAEFKLARMRAENADVYEHLLDLAVEMYHDIKKNDTVTPEQERLMDEYVRVANSHGIKLPDDSE
jgi:transcriptional regulator with XRE-family HTH domain